MVYSSSSISSATKCSQSNFNGAWQYGSLTAKCGHTYTHHREMSATTSARENPSPRDACCRILPLYTRLRRIALSDKGRLKSSGNLSRNHTHVFWFFCIDTRETDMARAPRGCDFIFSRPQVLAQRLRPGHHPVLFSPSPLGLLLNPFRISQRAHVGWHLRFVSRERVIVCTTRNAAVDSFNTSQGGLVESCLALKQHRAASLASLSLRKR